MGKKKKQNALDTDITPIVESDFDTLSEAEVLLKLQRKRAKKYLGGICYV